MRLAISTMETLTDLKGGPGRGKQQQLKVIYAPSMFPFNVVNVYGGFMFGEH